MSIQSAPPSVAPSRQSRQELLVELAAEFAETAAEHDRSGIFPVANLDRLRQAGLVGLTVPVAYGGAEAGLSDVVEVLGTIARGDPSTALVLAMTYLIHAHYGRSGEWPEEAYAPVARSTVEEGAMVNGLRVEPDLGTPARGGIPATTGRWTGDGWELTGHKIYSTGAPVLRWMLVWGATDPASDPVGDAASQEQPESSQEQPKSREPRVGTFLVPADAPGIEIIRTWDHFGMRATESHDVVFNRVRLDAGAGIALTPVSTLKDPAAAGSNIASWNGLAISAIYLGVAEAARDWLISFLHERVPSNLGKPLASLPRFQAAVGEIDVTLTTIRMLVETTAREVDAGKAVLASSGSAVKSVVTNAAINVVGQAVALIGNPGLTRANPLERHYRNVLCGRVHTPQDDAIHAAAGRALLAR
ncbi:acyl-CoA dehydrogenase domain-containing protein [Candidatus Protofrankia californiensis]|uniref:Acyl-CoA dehydrogenase domain-containing protein n=1 Tax=Candidatus Protofrankia californiensis TaxID=1839754 RepID=A0A1C3NTD6_9ACTN|nr:acyl-CoA dehydrogenase domain-containing protein [Candidatus Protofrankia californiensis]